MQAQLAKLHSSTDDSPAARGTRFVGVDVLFLAEHLAFSFVCSQQAEKGPKIKSTAKRRKLPTKKGSKETKAPSSQSDSSQELFFSFLLTNHWLPHDLERGLPPGFGGPGSIAAKL